MRRLVISGLALLILVLGVGAAEAGDGDALLGLWATDPEGGGGMAHVDVFMADGRYHGKIVWLAEPVYGPNDPDGPEGQPKVDGNNPDPERRNDPVVGLLIAEDFLYKGGGVWHKGTIYDPDNGKTYKCKMSFADDENTLKVRGFIGFSMLGRTTIWTRVE
ncbi:MAG: DUF2147 domain-containing protein [Thermoanaerobaculales bacterium]|jgi:uncharacterized protein (DUF2147 family)|nr:DUF2147 domain-containing protein [Thermoanaerobaculales bacterium]